MNINHEVKQDKSEESGVHAYKDYTVKHMLNVKWVTARYRYCLFLFRLWIQIKDPTNLTPNRETKRWEDACKTHNL